RAAPDRRDRAQHRYRGRDEGRADEAAGTYRGDRRRAAAAAQALRRRRADGEDRFRHAAASGDGVVRLIRPIDIDADTLADTNVPEEPPSEYSTETTYDEDDVVGVTDGTVVTCYVSLQDSNTGNA